MRRTRATTELVTVLFTDIVSSTRIAEEVGDRRWRSLVAAHHDIVRRALRRHHGRELDTAGDGFFAAFSKPADAIRCAVEVSDEVRGLGLEIRAGMHLGEAEIMDEKVGGVVVNTGARIMSIGKAGEVLVTSTVRDAVAGKGIAFVDHGVHQLKGLEGDFRVYDVSTVDGVARDLPLEPEEARRRRERPPVAASRRRPSWLAIAGAGVLVAAGIGIASVISSAGDDPAVTGATPAVEGRALTDADEQLVALVPTVFSASCVATDPLPTGAVGSVTCKDVDYEVRYDTYVDAQGLETAFGALTAGLELPQGSCRDRRAAVGSYEIDGEARGRVACFVERVPLAWGSTILWTDDAALILGRAIREDVVDFVGNVADLSLYEWWRTMAGPASSANGSFRPKDDPAEVPSGTFTSVITERDVGPSNDGGADERWVGTWTITLDGDTFVEELEGSYDEFESRLLWGKGHRMILVRDYASPPLGGVTRPCRALESLHWELEGETLVFSEPSPEPECRDFRGVAVFQPWERVPDGQR